MDDGRSKPEVSGQKSGPGGSGKGNTGLKTSCSEPGKLTGYNRRQAPFNRISAD